MEKASLVMVGVPGAMEAGKCHLDIERVFSSLTTSSVLVAVRKQNSRYSTKILCPDIASTVVLMCMSRRGYRFAK